MSSKRRHVIKGRDKDGIFDIDPLPPYDQSNFAISSTTPKLTEVDKQVGGHNGIGSFKANDESLTTAVPLIPLQSPSFITPMKNGQILQVGGKLASKAL